MKAATVTLGILMMVLTLLPLSKHEAWWVRIFDFTRPQIAVVSGALLLVYVLFFRGADAPDLFFLAGLAACVAYQAWRMFPYTPLAPRQVERSRAPRDDAVATFFAANVLQKNRQSRRLLDIIRAADPDVILMVETDDWWRQQLADLESTHRWTVHQPQSNTYGMLLYSRLELVDPRVKFLVEDDIPSIHTRVRLPSGDLVELRCVHPRPPVPQEAPTSIERDAELLLVGKEVKGLELPVVVMGDLNDVAWSRTNWLFQDVSGLLDPRIGRGLYNTFHAQVPFLRFPVDHVYHSNHFRLVDFRRLPYFGSDHFPVLIRLSLEPGATRTQEEPQADAEDHAEAEEKIAKAACTD